MPLCDNSRPPIGTWGNMISLTELLYEEIINLGENISYLQGRCDSIIEICAIYRLSKGKKYLSITNKNINNIEQKLLKISDELKIFADKIPKDLNEIVKSYHKDIIKKPKSCS